MAHLKVSSLRSG